MVSAKNSKLGFSNKKQTNNFLKQFYADVTSSKMQKHAMFHSPYNLKNQILRGGGGDRGGESYKEESFTQISNFMKARLNEVKLLLKMVI